MLNEASPQRLATRPDTHPKHHGIAGLALAAVVLAALQTVSAGEPISFNRDVRPILAEHCWRCHGLDEKARRSGLRLDDRELALRRADSGVAAIVPGKPDESELIERISSDDEQLRMPPIGSPRRLSEKETRVLRQWIAEGAQYQRHWAFEPLVKPAVPFTDGATNPIDAFVAVTLQEQGLEFALEADRETLLRRISFDLTGLPPALDDLTRAESEPYEQTVDRLLSSPHFGERMAVDWLDAARFADTDGYFGDKPRQMWLWRDWVIDALNRNMPFDQFTIEQLAGDLLPDRTISQVIATGFNRNHMSNNETGIIDEEYRVEYVIDRVDTTMSTWLGLTVGCAQCHDHKYDPISQREYYQLFAFFNNVSENGLLVGQDPPPRISVPTEMQQRQLNERAAATTDAVKAFEPLKATAASELAMRETDVERALPSAPAESIVLHTSFDGLLDDRIRHIGTTLQQAPGIRSQAAKFDATQHLECHLPEFSADGLWTIGFWLVPDGSLSCPVSKIEPHGDRRGIEVLWQKGRLVVNLVHRWGASAIEVATREPTISKQWHQVVVSYDGSQTARGLRVFVDGANAPVDVRRDSLTGTVATDQPLRIGRRDEGLGFYGLLDELRIVSREVPSDDAANWFRGERIRGILEVATGQRSARDAEILLDDYIDRTPDQGCRDARDAVRHARQAEQEMRASIPLALVMEELSPPRQTHLLERGQYDKPGEVVEPGTPAALSAWPDGESRNRLGFARWLVARDNPLTARVAVNRLWRGCFGEGLVRTMNDFGTKGESPTHPALLDYLAATFRDGGWDVKGLLRLIVTSRAYRQNSRFAVRETEVIDPENRWLSRGPSFRLPMEMIRDQALAVSGRLVPRIGGPSVKPFQPPGLWEDVSYNAEESYEPDQGAGLSRRSLYTFVKRQAPPPALLLFDGPTREKCTLRRPRTNTPLQALLLLNDQTYIEAAHQVALTTLAAQPNDANRLPHLYRSVLSRAPAADELRHLTGLLERLRQRFAVNLDAAGQLLSVGATEPNDQFEPAELAAWTVLAHTVLNLDEAVMRR
ncbi:MAG: DUF1553 domain-containing protein [Planctomycetaceae bacterium]|nr:DUF1553 domain-containing protein [Planctomycetaceae bacterium]